MVLAIAALVGYLGSRVRPIRNTIESIGTAVSIVVLFVIAMSTYDRLRADRRSRSRHENANAAGRCCATAASPWLAFPVGLLFGFGFETSSQVAAYAVAFGADAGDARRPRRRLDVLRRHGCTDTLDSVFIHRLITYRAGRLPQVMRLWIWSVTIFAIGVAAYEMLQCSVWKAPHSRHGRQRHSGGRTARSLRLDLPVDASGGRAPATLEQVP